MYRALADYYDALMADVPYARWAAFAAEHLPAGCGVDLGCGTGSFTLELARSGRRITGVDLSADMLRAACEKGLASGLSVPFVQGDMRDLVWPRPVDFVTAVCDGLNYVAAPEIVFERVRDMLKPGGVFLFDVSSQHKLTKVIADNTFFYDDGDLVYMWRNFPHERYIDMDLTFFAREGGAWLRSDESQRQYVHSADALARSLKASGFSLRTYGGYCDRPVRDTDERIVFVCRRTA